MIIFQYSDVIYQQKIPIISKEVYICYRTKKLNISSFSEFNIKKLSEGSAPRNLHY